MDVLEYYRLDEEPFKLSPNPRFLYLNDQVKQATAKVEYMTKHRTAPLYIYGAIGSGKTSILRRLFEELSEDETYTLRLVIAPNIKTANSFLRAIMDAFSVPTDRAYERSLKNYETSDVKLLQVVLTGQDELSDKVKRYKELSSRMIPIAINPMSPADLEDMLKFRWSIASGNKSQLPFSKAAFTEIFAYSKGLPRDAVKLADEILRHVLLQQVSQAELEHVTNATRELELEK